MFTQRLNELFQILNYPSYAELARRMGYKPSYISVLRSGRRVLTRGSQAAAKLAQNLMQAARDAEKTDAVRQWISCGPELTGDALAAEIEAWLTQGEPLRSGHTGRRPNASAKDAVRLGGRLDIAMQLTGLSNAHLARLAAVDPSVISRYRNGRRIPDASHDVVRRISLALYRRAVDQGSLEDLSTLTGIPGENLLSESQGPAVLQAWLMDPAAAEAAVVEDFLSSLDGISPAVLSQPSVSVSPVPAEEAEVYPGISGLRAAVRRFLQTALDQDAKELWLYSDQSTDWMTADPAFALDWGTRMRACLHQGVRIKIIHTIDRGLEEMLSAIRNWLPLYMTGQIEGWYSPRSSGSRFCHTLFLAPGLACISAWHPSGAEDTALYHYHTRPEDLSEDLQRFQDLLSFAQPLIRIRPLALTDSLHTRSGQNLYAIVNTLSLATMPQSLAESMALRLEPRQGAALLREWETERRQYRRYLTLSSVQEILSLPGPEDLARGQVPVDSASANLYYTSEEFAAHLDHVRTMWRENVDYHLTLLPEAPFSHIRILITGGSVTIRPLIPSLAAFTVSHPMMHAAFVSYAAQLQESGTTDTDALEQCLEAYRTKLPEHKPRAL